MLKLLAAQNASDFVVKTTGVALASSFWIPQFPEHTILVLLSGLAGGLCRWIATKEALWPNGDSNVIVGGLAAVFVWPAGTSLSETILGKLDLDPITSVMFGGFITGVLGISMIGFIVDLVRKRKETGK